MTKKEKLEQAKRRIQDLKKFYTHIATYFIVLTVLFLIDFRDGGDWWVHLPAIVWGAAIIVQGLSIGVFNSEWESRKIKNLMDKNS